MQYTSVKPNRHQVKRLFREVEYVGRYIAETKGTFQVLRYLKQ